MMPRRAPGAWRDDRPESAVRAGPSAAGRARHQHLQRAPGRAGAGRQGRVPTGALRGRAAAARRGDRRQYRKHGPGGRRGAPRVEEKRLARQAGGAGHAAGLCDHQENHPAGRHVGRPAGSAGRVRSESVHTLRARRGQPRFRRAGTGRQFRGGHRSHAGRLAPRKSRGPRRHRRSVGPEGDRDGHRILRRARRAGPRHGAAAAVRHRPDRRAVPDRRPGHPHFHHARRRHHLRARAALRRQHADPGRGARLRHGLRRGRVAQEVGRPAGQLRQRPADALPGKRRAGSDARHPVLLHVDALHAGRPAVPGRRLRADPRPARPNRQPHQDFHRRDLAVQGHGVGPGSARKRAARRGAGLPGRLRPGDAEVRLMIRINLLPHREAARKQKKAAFFAMLVLGAIVGAGVVLLVGGYNARRISIQESRNTIIKGAIVVLDKKIAEIATLKQEIEALKARQQAVEDLQGDRNQPVYLLDELVKQIPSGVYLKGFKQEGQKVAIGGYAQSQERVSELLGNLAGVSPWLERPELVEVKSTGLGQGKTAKKVVEFNLSVNIKRPRDKDAAASGAGQEPGARITMAKLNLNLMGAQLADQFRNLGDRHPGQWPLAPRVLCSIGVTAAVVVAGYFGYWSSQFDEQEAGAQAELKLRDEYKFKTAQAVNLEALRAQKVQVDQYVDRLQKQLPSKAEMDALLKDIGRAGTGSGLQFESFKPAQVVVKDYYAELPIDIRVTGSYHDIGAFAGNMANLSRIVTLNNMSLNTGKDGVLTLEAVVKTFRYLDPEEVSAQRKAAADKKKAAKKS